MNKSFPITVIFVASLLFLLAYGALAVQAHPAEEVPAPKAATYQAVLGKSLNDQDVASFLVTNRCTDLGRLQSCQAVGMALWIDQNKNVESIDLYPNASGFSAYQGTLPFGLSFQDTMETVETKLGGPVEIHAPQAGWKPGLPEQGGTSDRFHYWAQYQRFGLTVIYNSPSASDKSASIYAIQINK